MNTGKGIVVPGIAFGVGAKFSDNFLDSIIIWIVDKNFIKIVNVFEIVKTVFGIAVPGNKIEAEFVLGGGLKESFDPIFVVSSGSRTTEIIIGTPGTVHDCLSCFDVKSGVIWIFTIVPGTKKIGFVPNFVVNSGNIFINRIMFGGGFYQLVPLIPVFGGAGVLAVFGHIGSSIGKR